MDNPDERLKKQLEFVVEIDKLKNVFRQTLLMDKNRYENDAEHSWHLGVMAILLSEYAAVKKIDLTRVLKMILIHDIVEIDAGDTFCYDSKAGIDKNKREMKAAKRLYSILPDDQASELMGLWKEFESMSTVEARFAAALDRLQPLMHNYHTNGAAWQAHHVTSDQVKSRNRHIMDGAPKLWDFAEKLINDAVDKGYLAGEEASP